MSQIPSFLIRFMQGTDSMEEKPFQSFKTQGADLKLMGKQLMEANKGNGFKRGRSQVEMSGKRLNTWCENSVSGSDWLSTFCLPSRPCALLWTCPLFLGFALSSV